MLAITVSIMSLAGRFIAPSFPASTQTCIDIIEDVDPGSTAGRRKPNPSNIANRLNVEYDISSTSSVSQSGSTSGK